MNYIFDMYLEEFDRALMCEKDELYDSLLEEYNHLSNEEKEYYKERVFSYFPYYNFDKTIRCNLPRFNLSTLKYYDNELLNENNNDKYEFVKWYHNIITYFDEKILECKRKIDSSMNEKYIEYQKNAIDELKTNKKIIEYSYLKKVKDIEKEVNYSANN